MEQKWRTTPRDWPQLWLSSTTCSVLCRALLDCRPRLAQCTGPARQAVASRHFGEVEEGSKAGLTVVCFFFSMLDMICNIYIYKFLCRKWSYRWLIFDVWLILIGHFWQQHLHQSVCLIQTMHAIIWNRWLPAIDRFRNQWIINYTVLLLLIGDTYGPLPTRSWSVNT